MYPIPSDLGSQAELGQTSTTLRNHAGTPGAVVFFLIFWFRARQPMYFPGTLCQPNLDAPHHSVPGESANPVPIRRAQYRSGEPSNHYQHQSCGYHLGLFTAPTDFRLHHPMDIQHTASLRALHQIFCVGNPEPPFMIKSHHPTRLTSSSGGGPAAFC